MGKVFRLHTGDDNLVGWGESSAYGNTAIREIKDPNGATGKKEITSIPSPFARMDLVKTAFKIITESKELEGNSIHHKLVSDCFDVGEIFFNIDKFRDKIRILVWDKKKDLQALLDSDNKRHRLFGETLRLYLNQDAEAFNFNRLERIYLLDYIGPDKPHQVNIIGATSPATFFFTSANNLSYATKHLSFGKDRPFDDELQPLYKRDFDYQMYWFCLQKSMPDFADLYPEINTYLNLSYAKLSNSQKEKITALDKNSYDTYYENLSVKSDANLVEVLGFYLKKKKGITDVQSDFQIKSSVCENTKLPLVLPVDMYTKRLRYTVDVWDKDTKVPYNDSRLLSERSLPDDGTKYPYLTIGDFFEDYILWDDDEENKFNENNFFNGGTNIKGCYLLPLRNNFFSYFTVNELQGTMSDGKNMFELVHNAGGVKAILRVPIQRNEYITYERLYFTDATAEPQNNKGGVIKRKIGIALFPPIKFIGNENPRYRIALVREDCGKEKASLMFYQGNKPIEVAGKTERNITDTNYAFNETYILDTNFDYISLIFNESFRGCIVPIWKQGGRGNRQFTFAIDFGTTNTYIEYSVDKSDPVSFEIGEKDIQLCKVNNLKASVTSAKVLKHDYLPDMIGEAFKFPIRTVLSEGNTTNWNQAVFPMANTNIPFVYEKERISDYNTITTNLKWSNEAHIQEKVKHYLDALFLILRNKVLLNGGNLERTRIVWFYPASMTEGRYNNFQTIWGKLYEKNFGHDLSNIISMSESTAPYYFYKKKKNATTDVVSIDIGGGTTDVLVVNNGKEELLTSFRFAANSIWGDGYGFDADSNGFVNHFKNDIYHKLAENQLDELCEVMQNLEQQKKSIDIISFFFSLATNASICEKKVTIDFNNMLCQDGYGKYVFILFYVAIMYHIAHIMKAKGLKMPRHITFSGTGSKVLMVLTSNDRTLEKFTKLIFEAIYDQSYNDDGLTIIREKENPKEATCKGGLLNVQSQDYSSIMELKQTLLGDTSNTFTKTGLKYNDITETLERSVVEEVKKAIKLFFDLNQKFSYVDKFDAERSKWEVVQKYCQRDIMTYLKNGINQKKEEIKQMGTEPKIEETLFFYPFVGILNIIAQEVYK